MLTKSAVFSSLSFSAVVKSIVVLLPFLPPLTATDLAATLVGAEAEADCGRKGGGGWAMRHGAGGGARAGRPRPARSGVRREARGALSTRHREKSDAAATAGCDAATGEQSGLARTIASFGMHAAKEC